MTETGDPSQGDEDEGSALEALGEDSWEVPAEDETEDAIVDEAGDWPVQNPPTVEELTITPEAAPLKKTGSVVKTIVGWAVLGMMIGGFIGVMIYINIGDWESRHLEEMTQLEQHAEQAFLSEQFEQSRSTYDQLFALVGGRHIQSIYLQELLRNAHLERDQAQLAISKIQANSMMNSPALSRPVTMPNK